MSETNGSASARTALYVVVGAVVFLVAAGSVWLLFRGEGPLDLPDPVLAPAPEDPVEEVPEAPVETGFATIDVRLEHDPFTSVRPPEPVADPDDPVAPDDPVPPDDPAPPDDGCVVNGEAVCDGRVVALIEVTDDGASVQVDGVGSEVAPGESFADGDFVLNSAEDDCATIVYAAGSPPQAFTLCLGDVPAK